jgi:glutamyl-Q tRNA(Asp) synthetase
MSFATRFAPSPSGLLHLGHAFSALTAFEAAQAAGGRFVLRIEDIDTTRCRPEFDAAILEDLAWLGLAWEEPVRRQAEHFPEYAARLDDLRKRGLIYRCFKTRKEILEEIARAPHGPSEVYLGPAERMSPDEEAERVAQGESYAWRLSLATAREHLGARWDQLAFLEEGEAHAGEHRARPETAGDVVLARKDVATSYHLAVVHDDALQGLTHIVRGDDLFEATHIQVLLQEIFNLPRPVYRHHRLILDETTGKRFAKRDKAATLTAMRVAGETPEDIRARLGF